MRTLAEKDRALCSLQASLFESSLEASDCGSAVFVRRFMRSDLAKRMDKGAEALEVGDVCRMVREVDLEYSGRCYGSEKYTANELHWMGYVYRYWCLSYGESSKRVYGIVGARELRALYGPYHTLDAALAIERIREAKGIRDKDTSLEHYVRIMREVRARRTGSAD